MGVINKAIKLIVTLESYPRDIFLYRLTLLLLIFHHSPSWAVEIPIKLATLFMFFSSELSRNKWLWLVLFVGLSVFSIQSWYDIDNHQYLINYWVGACFISTLFKERVQILKMNAHILIFLTFLFAIYWK